MKIEKINNLTYVLRFNTSIEAKALASYLYKATGEQCERIDCEECELCDGCFDYFELIKAFRDMTL